MSGIVLLLSVGQTLLGGMVCGTVLQIAQRNAGVGIAARISCDMALMLWGAATIMLFLSKCGRDYAILCIMVGGLLVVTGAVAMTEGALLTTLLVLEDMAFPAS